MTIRIYRYYYVIDTWDMSWERRGRHRDGRLGQFPLGARVGACLGARGARVCGDQGECGGGVRVNG